MSVMEPVEFSFFRKEPFLYKISSMSLLLATFAGDCESVRILCFFIIVSAWQAMLRARRRPVRRDMK
jgi:hypothetical protein